MVYVLGGDVGGTNINLAVAEILDNGLKIVLHKKYLTKDYKTIAPVIRDILEHSNVTVSSCCIGGAGEVEKGRINFTNALFKIDTKEITKKCGIKNVFVLNDFQLIGYGLNFLSKKDVKLIKKGKKEDCGVISVIGAGTGLGKSILVYDDGYYPLVSEGGHIDFCPTTDLEWDMFKEIKGDYEDYLSGRGIINIFKFYSKNMKLNEFDKEIILKKDPSLVFKYKKKSKIASLTVKSWIQFYARCAKNFALDTMSTGGVYIAGGIAAKNVSFFGKDFEKEFVKSSQKNILKEIPVYVITNYDVSLYGALYAAKRMS